jgi:hypothetical protein
MTVQELLQELETLTHAQRMRHMVELGRASVQDPTNAQLLLQMEQDDFYQRWLAIHACYGSRDAAHIQRASNDSSRLIRLATLKLAPLVCNDEQVLLILRQLGPDLLAPMLRNLRKRKRYAVIDTFLAGLVNEPFFYRLFAFGSPDFVARFAEQFWQGSHPGNWHRLARSHPEHVTTHLLDNLSQQNNPDRQQLFYANSVLSALISSAPDQALRLVRAFTHHFSLNELSFQSLLRKMPAETLDLILASPNPITLSYWQLPRMNGARFIALSKQYPDQIHLYWGITKLLRHLPWQERLAVYEAVRDILVDSNGLLSVEIISLLPAAQREQEGRRHLALSSLASLPAQRLPYATFLPWDEARTLLDPYLRSPDANLRATVLETLCQSVHFQRAHLPELLTLLRERRREQEPVRVAMIKGLSKLPTNIWHQEHVADLEQIIADALNAPDISHGTITLLFALTTILTLQLGTWGAEQFARVARQSGVIHTVTGRYSKDLAHHLAPALQPVFRSWQQHENEGALILFLYLFRKRFRIFNELVEILEQMLRQTQSADFVRHVLPHLIKERPELAASLIPELLAADPSFITLEPVSTYLHKHRQDLLTPFLGQQAYAGHFSTGKTYSLLPLKQGFHRWTATQQEIFAQTLEAYMADEGLSQKQLTEAIEQLACLPAISGERLIALARDERPFVRDYALKLLYTLDDRDQSIPALLEALADERASRAIIVLRAYLKTLPNQAALEILRSVPLKQVTVAKETIRLIGLLKSEAAYQELLRLQEQDLHRDVRVALLSALWNYPEQPETWQILETAARSEDTTIALASLRLQPLSSYATKHLAHLQPYLLSIFTQQRLMALQAMLIVDERSEVSNTMLANMLRIPAADNNNVLLRHALSALNSPFSKTSRYIARAVFLTALASDTLLIGEAIRSVHPNRRALAAIVDELCSAPRKNSQVLPTVYAVLAALSDDPLTIGLRLKLAIAALPMQEVAAQLTQAVGSSEWHAEVLTSIYEALENVDEYRRVEDLAELERLLATSEQAELRRIALAALLALCEASNWTATRLDQLRQYRNDPSPLVAMAAQFTLPDLEENSEDADEDEEDEIWEDSEEDEED